MPNSAATLYPITMTRIDAKPGFGWNANVRRHQPAQCLPDYSRNLLKIQLPVAVTLATTKQSISQIVSFVPGSIIQFNKLCDESLTLEIGNHPVAEGEAVKVGDKFGLRITSMTPPDERLCILEKVRSGTSDYGTVLRILPVSWWPCCSQLRGTNGGRLP